MLVRGVVIGVPRSGIEDDGNPKAVRVEVASERVVAAIGVSDLQLLQQVRRQLHALAMQTVLKYQLRFAYAIVRADHSLQHTLQHTLQFDDATPVLGQRYEKRRMGRTPGPALTKSLLRQGLAAGNCRSNHNYGVS